MSDKITPFKVLKLKDPVKDGEKLVEELHFQKPRAKHLKGGNRSDPMAYQLRILQNVTLQPQHVIEELSLEDLMEAVAVLGESLPKSLLTGEA